MPTALYSQIAFLDITGRVARKLLDLGQSHGRRENVNRALHRFAVHGDIKQEGGLITILRPGELRKRA